jgi:hypothetical protein
MTDKKPEQKKANDANRKQKCLIPSPLIKMPGSGKHQSEDGGKIAVLQIDLAIIDPDNITRIDHSIHLRTRITLLVFLFMNDFMLESIF